MRWWDFFGAAAGFVVGAALVGVLVEVFRSKDLPTDSEMAQLLMTIVGLIFMLVYLQARRIL